MKEENENKSSRRINCNGAGSAGKIGKIRMRWGGHTARMKDDILQEECVENEEGDSYDGRIVRSDT